MIEAYTRTASSIRFVDTWSVPLGPDARPREELFLPDKLHFNADGYKLLIERVRPYLPK
jgi:lysophospholipase L1-like esterase